MEIYKEEGIKPGTSTGPETEAGTESGTGTETTTKKRGRKRSEQEVGFEKENNSKEFTDEFEFKTQTKRERKNNRKNTVAGSPEKSNRVEILAPKILAIHSLIAMMTGLEMLNISESESIEVTNAGLTILDQYNIKIDAKVASKVSAIFTLLSIYAPRLFIAKMKMDMSKKVKQQPNFSTPEMSDFERFASQ